MKLCLVCQQQHNHAQWVCPHCGTAPSQQDGVAVFAPELARGGGGFDPTLFAALAELEATNFWFRGRNALVLWALQQHFPSMTRYLEVGCGTGFVLQAVAEAFPQTAVTGSEIFTTALPYAAARVPRATLQQMDARHIPYRAEFDVIGAYDVLEHIDQDEAVLLELREALVQGGGVVLTVPQHMSLWSVEDEIAHHVRRYEPTELQRKVTAAGFDIVLDTSFVSLLSPAMWASRRLPQRNKKTGTNSSEFHLPSLVNTAFEHILAVERWGIRLGARYPVGGSRLLVARAASR
jgi:SAM-dependent methyltransferase